MIRVAKLSKIYKSGAAAVTVFRDLDLEIAPGDQVAVMGASGAGKSTLLQLIAGLDRPSSGSIFLRERNITQMTEQESAQLRNREIGYVWQQLHLMPDFTALENAMMPLLIRGDEKVTAESAAR